MKKPKILSQSYLVAPDEETKNLSKPYFVAQYEKSENLGQQKVPHILLASTFPYCGLGRGVVGSERFSRFPSLELLKGREE